EVAAPGGQRDGAGDGGSPDDLAADEPADVLEHRVAVVAGLADGDVGVGAEQHAVRAVDAALAELAERAGDGRRVLAHVFWQAHRRVAGARPDAVDAGGRLAVEDRAVLREGELAGGIPVRLPIGGPCAPRSTPAISRRSRVNAARSSTSDAARRCRASTPAAGASMSRTRPVPTADSS